MRTLTDLNENVVRDVLRLARKRDIVALNHRFYKRELRYVLEHRATSQAVRDTLETAIAYSRA